MSSSFFAWVVANKQWCFGAICTVSGGAFALVKWRASRKENSPKVEAGNASEVSGSQNQIAQFAGAATINGPVIVGSNNVQSVIITTRVESKQIPFWERKSSSPTGNEIRQKETATLKGIPLYLQRDLEKKLWDGYLNLHVAWPIRIYEIRNSEEFLGRALGPEEDDLLVEARWGEESWGACVRFSVKASDYPILKTLVEGHRAFVEGRIKRIDVGAIALEVSQLEVE
jgi:hypothetical protein